jgi:hypothetical protein
MELPALPKITVTPVKSQQEKKPAEETKDGLDPKDKSWIGNILSPSENRSQPDPAKVTISTKDKREVEEETIKAKIPPTKKCETESKTESQNTEEGWFGGFFREGENEKSAKQKSESAGSSWLGGLFGGNGDKTKLTTAKLKLPSEAKHDLQTCEESSGWFSGWFGQEDKDKNKNQEPSEEGGWFSGWFGSADESKGTDPKTDGGRLLLPLKEQSTPEKLSSLQPQTKAKAKDHGKTEAKADKDESSGWFSGLFLETDEKREEPIKNEKVKYKFVQLVPKTMQRASKGEEESGWIAFFYIKNGQLEELDSDEITIFTRFK